MKTIITYGIAAVVLALASARMARQDTRLRQSDSGGAIVVPRPSFCCGGPQARERADARAGTRHRLSLGRSGVGWFRLGEDADQSEPGWLTAWPEHDRSGPVAFGSRVVIAAESRMALDAAIEASGLREARRPADAVAILEAADPRAAFAGAERLGMLAGVTAAYPVMRFGAAVDGLYAPWPNDFYFDAQWYLENRFPNGTSAGVDLNVRGAWPITRGEGVRVAVADSGVELHHPDLASRAATDLHFNFDDLTTNATPAVTTGSFWAHGTAVTGLIVAEQNNGIGMSGVAPGSSFASWRIFTRKPQFVSDERLMDMYQYRSQEISVQNHSWGNDQTVQRGPTPLELIGISNAITAGRGGRGIVMVRSGGNNRVRAGNVSDDGYASDPRVITVGATGPTGRATASSEPGAAILVAAPVQDSTGSGLFTTDLVESRGVVTFPFFPPHTNLWDYRFNAYGFPGTSASAPLVSGTAALILGANPDLTYRDVQQVMLHSARHFDWADPDLRTNGAGLWVSHNVGFGIPDAAQAVQLAQVWRSRPELDVITVAHEPQVSIPDDGLRVSITGSAVPADLRSIICLAGQGPHLDEPTAIVPLAYAGLATNEIVTDLTGKGALIQRSGARFLEQLRNAAKAGAIFGIIFNDAQGTAECPGGDSLCPMSGAEYSPIPVAFISQTHGERLRTLIDSDPEVRAQIRIHQAEVIFTVSNSLACEHVAVRVQTDHPLRGDLRISLISPAGTRSILQQFNSDTNAGPVDWTYTSTHHMGEASAGEWRLLVTDQFSGAAGRLLATALTVQGVAITDSDRDGLPDDWEQTELGSLASGPASDPDQDGAANLREYLTGSNPAVNATELALDISVLKPGAVRFSWPGMVGVVYGVFGGTDPAVLNLVTNVPGRFPETEWAVLTTNAPAHQFFQIRQR